MTSCIFNTGAAPVSNPVFRIRTSQTKLLERVLAKAFYNDPCATYILPDARKRRAAVSWFFASVAIPASRHCGQAYTTINIDGGALWIRLGNEFTIMQAVWAPMTSLLFDLDRSSIARWVNVIGYLELARRSLTDKPYWQLSTSHLRQPRRSLFLGQHGHPLCQPRKEAAGKAAHLRNHAE